MILLQTRHYYHKLLVDRLKGGNKNLVFSSIHYRSTSIKFSKLKMSKPPHITSIAVNEALKRHLDRFADSVIAYIEENQIYK